MLIRTPFHITEQFLAAMVMPRSRSRSMVSMSRSLTSWLALNRPLWRNMASTRVVLPWSTWAMMAMFRKVWFIALSMIRRVSSLGSQKSAI